MKIIAIDPGYDRVGIAILERDQITPNKEVLLYSECFTTDKKKDLSERIYDIGEQLGVLIKKYQPKYCAIENVFVSNNTKTVIGVSEAKGVIKYVAQKEGLSIYEFSPPQIKAAITGNGSADKKQVMAMIPHLVKLSEEFQKKLGGNSSGGLDDELDAIAVGLTFFALYSYTEEGLHP